MEQKILNHYLKYGVFTYPGLYENYFNSLPDDIEKIGRLLRWSFIHRTTLEKGNTGTNLDLKFGDMGKVPWYRQAEDDNLVTATAIIAELFRRDPKGLTFERKVENKVVLTCRYVAILMAAILKAKKIPARVRSGFAGYWPWTKVSSDHWINQYWDKKEGRWVSIDIDGSFHNTGFDMYDIPEDKFDYSADAWLNVRQGKVNDRHFWNAANFSGLIVIAWELFYDFHCLMNNEIIYLHHPKLVMLGEFEKLSEDQLQEIDHLAELMQKPDDNFDELGKIWNTEKKYRMLAGVLL
ncbi:MAG: transglutaminase-like domain-containing protein [Candidatus Levybacteria bacterium]|nr:transglutaminase-like domain-containing protein [Candidatus Levybacteria bacterium]